MKIDYDITSVPALKLERHKVNECLVKHIEELLDLAKKGELVSLSYFGECTERMTICGTVGKIDKGRTLLALRRAELSLLDVMIADEWQWNG